MASLVTAAPEVSPNLSPNLRATWGDWIDDSPYGTTPGDTPTPSSGRLGVKGSQVQILSARRGFSHVRYTMQGNPERVELGVTPNSSQTRGRIQVPISCLSRCILAPKQAEQPLAGTQSA